MRDFVDPKQPYWNMEMEPLFGTPEMKEIKNRKLSSNIQKIYEGSPFTKRRMDDAGISPKDIRTVDDLKLIPIFGQPELRELMGEFGFDLKKLTHLMLGEDARDIAVMSATSGSTGIPTPYPLTGAAIESRDNWYLRALWRIGVRPGDVVVQAFGLSMFLAGVPLVIDAAKIPGVTVLPVGAEAGTERILNYCRIFGGNVLMCTPSLALYMIEKAPKILGGSIRSLGIKTVLCGGEPGAGIPEVRKRIENEYGAALYDFGAGAGVSCNHPEYQGMHWIMEDMVHYNLVDPDTKEDIPLEDGNTGLAVFSYLEKPEISMGMFRQTMGDIQQVFVSECPCGKTGFRYKVVGRTDDMLKIKGVMIYPAQVKNAVEALAPKTTGEFRILLDEPPPRVVPPLKIQIEYGADITDNDIPNLDMEMVDKFHSMLKIRPQIEWLKPETLERSEKKTKYIVKLYEK